MSASVLVSGGVITVGGGGFVLGVSAGGLADAFLLGMAGAIAVVVVSAFVSGIRWIWRLDGKVVELAGAVETGFASADAHRLELGDELRKIGERVETVEAEFKVNDGTTALDAIRRIDRRSRKVAESVGAVDYDDEDEDSDEVTGHRIRRRDYGPPAPRSGDA